MSQNYYYNGTQLNDWDGTKGVIVSTIDHDAGPEVSLTEAEVARGPGKVLRQAVTRGKRINITGAVIGTDQPDFESRLDALKALLSSPGQLKVTNYGTLDYRIAVFEEGEAWARQFINSASVDDSPLWDFTHYKIGRRGLILEAATGSPKTATLTQTFDLSSFSDSDTVKLWAYVPDSTKLTSIKLQFQTSGGNDYSTTWSTFTNGWNELTVLRSALTTTGSPSWANITSLILTVTGSHATAATITFDDLRISTTADSRTYDVAVDGTVQIQRDHYHASWVPFSVSFSVSAGTAVSDRSAVVTVPSLTVNQAILPRYFSGSGRQDIGLKATVGSSVASSIDVYDHVADTFGSYEGRYWTSVSTFETSETWTGGSADTSNKKFGSQGRKVTATASTTATSVRAVTGDYSALPNTDLVSVWVYLDNATNCASVDVLFETTPATDFYTATWNAGLATGWNHLTMAKRSLVATGSPSWGSVTSLTVSASANGSGTINATFDALKLVSALGPTGGRFTVGAPTAFDGWEIGEVGAYKHPLCHVGGSGSHATLTGTQVRDGEILALVRSATGGRVGFYARSSGQNPPSASAAVLAFADAYSSTTSLFGVSDGRVTNVLTPDAIVTSYTDWAWLRVVCKGPLVELYRKGVDENEWTKAVEASTDLTGGYWGLYASSDAQFAHVEIIDYAATQRNALSLLGGPFDDATTGGMLLLDTKALAVREGPYAGTSAGTFPDLSSGFCDAAVIQPAAVIGTPRFRDVWGASNPPALPVGPAIGGWNGIGVSSPPATGKVGIKFSSGGQTFIRRRGTFIYLAKTAAQLPAPGDTLTVRIETDSAGSPSGTLADANATATLTAADITSQTIGGFDFNASIVPIEVLWPADIPVSASTSYWLVIQGAFADNNVYWQVPYIDGSGGNDLKADNGSGWSGGANDGCVILAGNYPNASVSTPWSITTAYRPSFL